MSDDERDVEFDARGAVYVMSVGAGLVSAGVHEMLPAEWRPAYVIGARGKRGVTESDEPADADEQWVLSWVTVAQLAGCLSALRDHMPEQFHEEFDSEARSARFQGVENLRDIEKILRRRAGAQ